MQTAYAKALERLIEGGLDEAKAVEKLVANLAERGRLKLLPLIRAELAASAARKKLTAPRIEAASEKEKHEAFQGAKAAGIEASEVTVNPKLIRGWRARAGSIQVDRSGKRALVDLYRAIVTD